MWYMVKINLHLLTAGALPPAWCSLFLCASRYCLKGFCRDGPSLGTDLTLHSHTAAKENNKKREEEEKQSVTYPLSSPSYT